MTALAVAGEGGPAEARDGLRGLDATEVLLSTVMASTDEELHAARMAAFRSPVREQLLKPWVPPEGCEAGSALLATHPLFGRHRTTLAHRLGVVTRRLQSEGVGYYLLSPVEQESRQSAADVDDQADAGGDAGHVSAPVALAMAAAAVLLLATAGAGLVNGATLLGWLLLLAAARPLVRWASYEDRRPAPAGPVPRPPAARRRPAVVLPDPGRYACPRCRARFRTAGDKRRHLRDCADLTGGPR